MTWETHRSQTEVLALLMLLLNTDDTADNITTITTTHDNVASCALFTTTTIL